MIVMEKIPWFVPITGVHEFHKYTKLRAFIQYFQQYLVSFFVSYLIMAIIYSIGVLIKRRKKNTSILNGYGMVLLKKLNQKRKK